MNKDPEKKKSHYQRWYSKHREERCAKKRTRYAANRDKERERHHNWYMAHKEKNHERVKKWRSNPENRKRENDAKKKREKITHSGREAQRRYRQRLDAKCRIDSSCYAKWRSNARVLNAKKAIRENRRYKPRFWMRIPDFAVKGFRMDARSDFLVENATTSQRAYARELRKDRVERGSR